MSKLVLPNRRSYSYRLRPFVMIGVHNGSNTNDNQLVEPWRFDANAPYSDEKCVDFLLTRLEELYKLGYKDFGIHMPVGNVATDTTYYSVNQWTGLPVKRREALIALKNWITDKRKEVEDLSFALYTSVPARDDFDLTQVGLFNNHIMAPNPNGSQNEKDWLIAQVDGWIGIGIDRLWLDTGIDANNEPGGLGTTLNKAAQYQVPFYESLGLNTGLEAFPIDDQNWGLVINEEYGSKSCICTSQFLDIYDKMVYDSFTFDYNATTRVCTITSAINSITGPTYTQGNAVPYWQEGDTLYIGSANNGFEFGSYMIQSVNSGTTFTLQSSQPFVTAGLPVSNKTGVQAQYTRRPGLFSSNWATNDHFNELAVGFFPSWGYRQKDMEAMLANGIRVGYWNHLNTTFDADAKYTADLVIAAYNAYLGGKVTQRKIWKQN